MTINLPVNVFYSAEAFLMHYSVVIDLHKRQSV